MTDALAAARRYADAGVCTIPIRADGSKSPDLPAWKTFQGRMPTAGELDRWHGSGTPHGVATVCGAVSGNLHKLDFDEPGLYERFLEVCAGQGFAALVESMPLIETPSGGRHLEMRCSARVPGNQKLAQRPVAVAEGEDGARLVGGRWVKVKTLIETRGEGGYTLAPGSPASCHPTGRTYRYLRGRPDAIPTITPEDLSVLLALASTLNEYVEPSAVFDAPRRDRAAPGDELRPGDDYNARGDYEAALERHGWHRGRLAGDKGLWRRPGKDGRGISATSNYGGSGLLYVFSSNAAPFEPQRAYSPFAAYALLEHGGDFTEAARALGQQGYGEPRPPGGAAVRGYGENAAPGAAPAGRGGEPAPAWEPPIAFTDHALPVFPVEALPPVLADFASEIAQTVRVPVDVAAVSVLSVAGAAGCRSCEVQIGRTHAETLNLWTICVGLPGSRKSTVDAHTKAPLQEEERRMLAEAGADIAAAAEKQAIEQARLGELRGIAAKGKTPDQREEAAEEACRLAASQTQVPVVPRLLADDVTPEKLGEMMADQGGAISIFSAEGGIFGIAGGRYNDKGGPNLDLLLKSKSGEEYRCDRKGGRSVIVPRARLSLGLGVQPDVLDSLADTPGFRGRGLLGRFLYCLPESLIGFRPYADRPIAEAKRDAYHGAVRALLRLQPPPGAAETGALHGLRVTGEALRVWAEFADDVEARQAPGGDLSGLTDWASKLAGDVARIAGILHLVGRAGSPEPWQAPVSAETMAAAWAIGQYLIPHAQAAFGQMGADPRLTLAKRILRWVERAGLSEFTGRICHQAHRGVTSADDLAPGLALLVERGFLRVREMPEAPGRGRPKTPVYEVNPLAQNTQNTQK